MNEVDVRSLDFRDRYVVQEIIMKYGFDEMTALKKFITSETYRMLTDKATAVYTMSPEILFDMWECEQITGEPRNSLYIRCDECV